MALAKEPRKIYPGELAVFWLIANDHFSSIPQEVMRVAEAIGFVIAADNQRVARTQLNKRFCRLREVQPTLFPAVLDWLQEKHTQELFSCSGAHWARIKLIKSVEHIIKGDKPHAAFGMDQNRGAPPLWGFTVAEDAAGYAQHLHLNQGINITDAKKSAADLFKTHRRDIDRAKLPVMTPNEAREWALSALKKFKITP